MALAEEQRSVAADMVRYATPAERWFRDTALEAARTSGHGSTRKEIISAASFLETYIFEWTRSLAVDRLDEYFPPMPRFQIDPRFKRSLKRKWKQIPAELYLDRVIPICPQLKLLPLARLEKYRHSVIHTKTGRRVTVGTPKKPAPIAPLGEPGLIPRGWALGVARQLVAELHTQLGTPPPIYL